MYIFLRAFWFLLGFVFDYLFEIVESQMKQDEEGEALKRQRNPIV